MNPLQLFYNNIQEREAVKEFLLSTLKELAVDKAFRGETVVGIAEAKIMVDLAFSKLDDSFGEKPKKIKRTIR